MSDFTAMLVVQFEGVDRVSAEMFSARMKELGWQQTMPGVWTLEFEARARHSRADTVKGTSIWLASSRASSEGRPRPLFTLATTNRWLFSRNRQSQWIAMRPGRLALPRFGGLDCRSSRFRAMQLPERTPKFRGSKRR